MVIYQPSKGTCTTLDHVTAYCQPLMHPQKSKNTIIFTTADPSREPWKKRATMKLSTMTTVIPLTSSMNIVITEKLSLRH